MKYDPEHKEIAKREGLCLYTLHMERKYTVPNERGGSSLTKGACSEANFPVLRFAQRVLHYEWDIPSALKFLHDELQISQPENTK